MIRYTFRDEPLTIKAAKQAKPQVIGTALAKIAKANGGHLMPGTVVDEARDPKHPLHVHFEWDDSKAAESYRLEQAREIIRVVRVEDDTRIEPPRAFLSVSDGGSTSYRPLAEVLNSASLQTNILDAAMRDLRAFERRYAELADVCSHVAKAREAIERKRVKNAPAAAA